MAKAGMSRTRGGKRRRNESDLRRTSSARMAIKDSNTWEASKNLKNAVKDDAQMMKENAMSRYSDRKDAVERYIRENPTKAVGIAIGAGMILGMIFGAAMARNKDVDEEYRRRWDKDYC